MKDKRSGMTPYSAKLIAMIDLFAFLLIVILFLYLSNPSQAELDSAMDRFDLLAKHNSALEAEYEKQMNKNVDLQAKNLELYGKVKKIQEENEKQRLARAMLAKKFYREYNEIMKKVEKKKKQAMEEGKTIDDPDHLILESAMEWAAELSDLLAKYEVEVTDYRTRAEQAVDRLKKAENELTTVREEMGRTTTTLTEKEKKIASLYSRIDEFNQLLSGSGGKFRVAAGSFTGGDFKHRPVDELVDENRSKKRISRILDEYKAVRIEYPYLFIIGHASEMDTDEADDRSYQARVERNWVYAARRAAAVGRMVVENMIERGFEKNDLEKLVVVSSGEMDLKHPDHPEGEENAWVEVVFGRDWKLPTSQINKNE